MTSFISLMPISSDSDSFNCLEKINNARKFLNPRLSKLNIDNIFKPAISNIEKDTKVIYQSISLDRRKVILIHSGFLIVRDELLALWEKLPSDQQQKLEQELRCDNLPDKYTSYYLLFNVIQLQKIYQKIQVHGVHGFYHELILENDFNGALEVVKNIEDIPNKIESLFLLSQSLIKYRVFDKGIEAALLIGNGPGSKRDQLLSVILTSLFKENLYNEVAGVLTGLLNKNLLNEIETILNVLLKENLQDEVEGILKNVKNDEERELIALIWFKIQSPPCCLIL